MENEEISQTPDNHLSRKGCYICGDIRRTEKRKKSIDQLDKITKQIIASFSSAVDAENALKSKNSKVSSRKIGQVCLGRRKTHAGFKWQYSKLSQTFKNKDVRI